MAGGEGFHLTVSDVPALGLHPESASYCFKQAFVAAGAAADARVTEIKTSRSGDRRLALAMQCGAAAEAASSEGEGAQRAHAALHQVEVAEPRRVLWKVAARGAKRRWDVQAASTACVACRASLPTMS
jgi:hypothetical protein